MNWRFLIRMIPALLVPAAAAEASGWSLAEAVFVSDLGADYDDPFSFYRGRIGIVKSGMNDDWGRPDITRLYAAYRILSGKSFTDAEIQLLRQAAETDWAPLTDAVLAWLDVRKQIAGAAPIDFIDTTRRGRDGYSRVDNCNRDAFHRAVLTLQDRASSHGIDSPWLAEWLTGQDTVFANCSLDTALPPLPVDAPAWLVADRAYQEAAAMFYRAEFEAATAAFGKIAADSASPWRKTAAYLVARSWGRMAGGAQPSNPSEGAAKVRAIQTARAVIADPSLAEYRGAAEMILFRLDSRNDTPALAREMADKLMTDLQQLVIDFGVLTDAYRTRNTDLGDWIVYVSEVSVMQSQVAVRHWRETGSIPWLLAALMAARPGDPDVPALLEAVAELDPQSSAFPTALYHRNRLRLAQGEIDAVRNDLDRVLARDDLNRTTRNEFMIQRQALARGLHEFLQYGAMTPAAICYPDSGSDCFGMATAAEYFKDGSYPGRIELADGQPRYFGFHSAVVFNGMMPLGKMWRATTDPDLPPNLAHDLVQATLVRAILLGRHRVGQEMARRLAADFPRLRELLQSYADASPGDRERASTFLLLYLPGGRPFPGWGFGPETPADRIASFGPRWWGGFGYEPYYRCEAGPPVACSDWQKEPIEVNRPDFLTDEDLRQARQEIEALIDIPNPAQFLGERVLAWAAEQPDDPRLPEALHRVVRLTRYAATHSPQISQRAFAILHSRYGDSIWAERTPYWY